jgi:hypothetical protein
MSWLKAFGVVVGIIALSLLTETCVFSSLSLLGPVGGICLILAAVITGGTIFVKKVFF